MSQDARAETPGAVSNQIVERAGDKGGRPIGQRMRDRETQRDDDKRDPGKSPEWNSLEFFRDQVAQQKATPENLLDQRHDEHEPQESHHERGPAKSWVSCKGIGIKSGQPRRKTEELLWRNPKREGEQGDGDCEDRPAHPAKFVFVAEINQNRGAEQRLKRV